MYARRRRRYFTLMTICLTLFVSAWAFVRLISVPLAIAMCVIAAVIPPIAAIVANRREPDEQGRDDQQDGSDDRSGSVEPDVEVGELDLRLWEEELRNHRSDEER
jgi:hypothetical protein